jgi:2-deoxy-D-gluconate 3-dehydrogenase
MTVRPFRLDGRHALVTAAADPLGRPFALALAEAGATVSVTTLRAGDAGEEAAVNSVVNECWTLGRDGRALAVDLASEAAVETAIVELWSGVGPIDILVNAAYQPTLASIARTGADEWRAAVDRHATAAFNAMRAAGTRMAERGYGRIVSAVSVLAERGAPETAAFAASQGALLALTRALALEWVRAGVTVNALGIGALEGVPIAGDAVWERVARSIPLRRHAAPADLQGALVYLASEEAALMTGELLVVDGGLHART